MHMRGRTAHLAKPIRADELAAAKTSGRCRMELVQHTLLCILREESVADTHEKTQRAGCRIGLEIGVGVTGMGEHAEERQAGRLEPAIELQREKYVGKLLLGVEGEAAIGLLALDILEMDTAAAMQLGTDGDDACTGRRRKQRQQV